MDPETVRKINLVEALADIYPDSAALPDDAAQSWTEEQIRRHFGGAARLGEGASIGNGFWMTAHGGAVETLLDEATAELGKLEFSPMLATIEISFRIVKAVPLHTTLRLDCEACTFWPPRLALEDCSTPE
ncbi:hypothetical protein WJX81_003342 [Elliptochloris bilobata]|uniref:Uncharacterized protein n=1 Tax=Elliptochloris bilobata TaxID=381761 RepID=A0AAW1RHT0_9CHLO